MHSQIVFDSNWILGLLNEEKDNNGVEFGKYFNTATYNIRYFII